MEVEQRLDRIERDLAAIRSVLHQRHEEMLQHKAREANSQEADQDLIQDTALGYSRGAND